jgi:hypothetical protein
MVSDTWRTSKDTAMANTFEGDSPKNVNEKFYGYFCSHLTGRKNEKNLKMHAKSFLI